MKKNEIVVMFCTAAFGCCFILGLQGCATLYFPPSSNNNSDLYGTAYITDGGKFAYVDNQHVDDPLDTITTIHLGAGTHKIYLGEIGSRITKLPKGTVDVKAGHDYYFKLQKKFVGTQREWDGNYLNFNCWVEVTDITENLDLLELFICNNLVRSNFTRFEDEEVSINNLLAKILMKRLSENDPLYPVVLGYNKFIDEVSNIRRVSFGIGNPDYEKLIDSCALSLEKNSQLWIAYYLRAKILFMRNKYVEAAVDIKKCMELYRGEISRRENDIPFEYKSLALDKLKDYLEKAENKSVDTPTAKAMKVSK